MKINYKFRYQLLQVLVILLCLPFFVQSQVITFQKVYPSSKDKAAMDVIPTSDGGYIMTGMTNNSNVNDMDAYILKTNNLGDTMWTRSYGGPKPDQGNRIMPTADGNYFIIGCSQSYGGGDYDIYLLKINPTGGMIWYKTYGGSGNDNGNEIIATTDGNYMITGTTYTTSSNSDAFLMKIDPAGNVLWEKYYGGPADDQGNSLKQSPDGGYVMAGLTFSYGQGGDAYLVKTNAIGDTTWTKNYGGPLNDEAKYVLANSDGSITFCVRDSSTGAGDIDIQVIKVNSVGAPLWNKVYGGTKKDTPKMIQPTSDGGYIVCGHSRSFGWITPQMWLIRLNSIGDSTWTRHYGGSAHQHCYAARQTADGGYIAAGFTRSYSPIQEIMFLKLDPTGAVGIEEIAMDNNIAFNIYPNPTDGLLKIDIVGSESYFTFKINNTLGQEVYTGTINFSGHNVSQTINLENFESGAYFLNIQSEKSFITKKIMLR
ncbi:MAG TPA: T9SS type A sorting domain-containing protein [Bacteroidia bacterium]|jgi:hypothetical protein|nr:T9SS type A sorting domain-containing protein [Bacteroidia bacterium]